MHVRAREPADRDAVARFLARWHSARVARRGALETPLDHPALVAEEDGRLHDAVADHHERQRRGLRFYQRRGFRLARLHAGAVDDSRERLKPELPRTGNHGIPIRDEIELEKPVSSAA